MVKAACFEKREDETKIPALLEKICRRFIHRRHETPFGYILQWRVYLRAVAQSAISGRQARWSLDGQEVSLMGKVLYVRQPTQLLVSEYRRAGISYMASYCLGYLGYSL
jgi:hypothetical protein